MKTVERILSKMSSISKPQTKFLVTLFSTIMALRGRVNFRNLSRYCNLHEKTFSRNFRKSFDFSTLNCEMIKEIIPKNNRKIAAMDASYIKKVENKVMALIFFGMVLLIGVKKDKKYHYFLLLI